MNSELKTSFNRNVITLMTGTTLAQALPLIVTPILTRIYTPNDFGLLALFVAIIAVFGSIANGRYELAIMLPYDDKDAINIAALSVLISTFVSILLFIIVLVFSVDIASALNNRGIITWLYISPLVVWLISIFNVLNYLNSRKKAFKDLALAKVYKSVTTVSVQLVCGYLKLPFNGLILGVALSHFISNVKLTRNMSKKYEYNSLSFRRIKVVAKRYINFPKYSMWAILCNNLSTHLINFLTSIYFSMKTLGMYSLAQTVVGAPAALIGNAFGQVYFQQANLERQQTGLAVESFKNALLKLSLIALLVFSVIFFFSEPLFAFAFGDMWRDSGAYAQVLAPFFAVRFVASALSITNSVFEKQLYSLIWQVLLLVFALAVISLSIVFGFDFYSFLLLFSLIMTLHYLALLLLLYYVSNGKV